MTHQPASKSRKVINKAPSTPLDVFVFGEDRYGELGLCLQNEIGSGNAKVKRPRLNTRLGVDDAGIVQFACGANHVVALCKDNTILSWGQNDQGALGRNGIKKGHSQKGAWEGEDLIFSESVPAAVDTSRLDPTIVWTQVVASGKASFALTEYGDVYGWGTFWAGDRILGFGDRVLIQRDPTLIPDIKNVKQLAAGAHHVLALDTTGKVYAWGCGQQNQLGRKVFEGHHAKLSLRPISIGALPIRGAKAVKVACGSYHSFVLDQNGRVYAWGLNAYAQLGIDDISLTSQLQPCLVQSLKNHNIVDIAGGQHHSLACSKEGKLFTWGRADGYQVGQPRNALNADNAIFDSEGKTRVLTIPTAVKDIPPIMSVAAGTDHNFAITADGKVYSWGYSESFQTGHGTTNDIQQPTLIENTATKGKWFCAAGAGGHYSVLAAIPDETM